MNKTKNLLFEMMGKVNSDYRPPQKGGIPYEEIAPEDQELFDLTFQPEDSRLRGASGPDYNGNYLTTRNFRNWDSPEGKQFRDELNKKAEIFNSKSRGHDIILRGFQDWDTDDDRYWDASYTFTFIPKQ